VSKSVTQAVEELVRATVQLSDADMGRAWKWRDYEDEGLRFALLMTHHELRDLGVRLAARQDPSSQAQRILAQYHQAYRDLSGLLAGVRTEDLDRVPAEGEWTLREALQHMLRTEHGFLARIRFAFKYPPGERLDPDSETKFLAFRKERHDVPDDATAGPIESIRNRFFENHRRVLVELADVSDAQLEIRSWFWESEPMPIRFRMHRFEEHLRQHTIQLDKTLAVVRPPTEAQRLVRNIYDALAVVESASASAEELRAAFAATISERAAAIAG
jgi:hypothetical protein